MTESPGQTLARLHKQAFGTAARFIPITNPMPPFAITEVPDGKGELIGSAPDANPNETIQSFFVQFRELAKKGELTAFALGLEVTVTNRDTGAKQDALQIRMEHVRYKGGTACIVPFVREGDSIKWGKLSEIKAQPMVWDHS